MRRRFRVEFRVEEADNGWIVEIWNPDGGDQRDPGSLLKRLALGNEDDVFEAITDIIWGGLETGKISA